MMQTCEVVKNCPGGGESEMCSVWPPVTSSCPIWPAGPAGPVYKAKTPWEGGWPTLGVVDHHPWG